MGFKPEKYSLIIEGRFGLVQGVEVFIGHFPSTNGTLWNMENYQRRFCGLGFSPRMTITSVALIKA